MTLQYATNSPEIISQLNYFSYFSFDFLTPSPDNLVHLLTYWRQIAPKRLLQVDQATTALTILMFSLNLGDTATRRLPTLLTYGILLVAITVIATTFFADQLRHPPMLGAVVPLRPSAVALLRGLTAWLIVNVGLLLAAGLVVAALALSPEHDLGLWRFPVQVPHLKVMQLVPLWQMLLRYLGLYNLWFGLFISAAHLIRQFTKDASVAMFLIALLPFADFFHLLDHLPRALVHALPSFYVNLPALVNHQLQYVNSSAVTVVLVFASWMVGLWLIATAMAAIRSRRQLPLVTNA
ncbi:hypothetical protein [Lacticaseibacillus suihuaensis]